MASIEINKINIVATWDYNTNNKDCVCGKSLHFPSTVQIDKHNIDRNNIAFGDCGHAFHKECINAYLKTNNNTCPLDQKYWMSCKSESNIKYSVLN